MLLRAPNAASLDVSEAGAARRDRCHYGRLVETLDQAVRHGRAPYLAADDVLDIASRGAALGCLEALFTLDVVPRTDVPRPGPGSTNRATARPWPISARWRSWVWRRPGC